MKKGQRLRRSAVKCNFVRLSPFDHPGKFSPFPKVFYQRKPSTRIKGIYFRRFQPEAAKMTRNQRECFHA